MATVVLLPLPGSRTRRGTSTIGGVRPGGRSAGFGFRSRSCRRRLPGFGSAASGRRGTTSVAGVLVMGAGPLAFGHDSHLLARNFVSNGVARRLRPGGRPERLSEQDARLRERGLQVTVRHADTPRARHAVAKWGLRPGAVSTMSVRAAVETGGKGGPGVQRSRERSGRPGTSAWRGIIRGTAAAPSLAASPAICAVAMKPLAVAARIRATAPVP